LDRTEHQFFINDQHMKSLRFNCIGLIALFICAVPSLFAETVWLSSLDLNQMTTGWSVAKADREITGQPIIIAKEQFDHGVGTHAASSFRVNVGGNATRFAAQVGVDDSAGGQGSVEFIVSGDGKILWRSGVMTGGQAAIPADVDLARVKVLGLRVTDGGDGASNDHADWADAKIITKDGSAKPLVLPPYEKFSVQTKKFALNFEVGDDGRLYQHAVSAADANKKLQRSDESYPQAGDGYIWEPALQVVDADGNPSTALIFEGVTRTRTMTLAAN
jgi:alpha-galactosidase